MGATGAALVVHDLKNELGALEARLEGLALQPAAATAAQAHQQCRALRQRLVMYLTVYGHEGPLRAHREDESPAELLQGLVRRHATPALPVTAVLPDDAPAYWHYDRRLVVMALDAALHNALRYARGQVQLTLRTEAGHLVLTVDDDGPGPGPGTPADPASTGLGTTLCRAVAQAHGHSAEGSVRLFSRPSGGARFELWLPT